MGSRSGGLNRPVTPRKQQKSYLIIHGLPPAKSEFSLALIAADVARIAELARLELDAAEASGMLGQLNQVLGLIEDLQSVDTQGVEPMTHAGDLSLRLRLDAVTEPDRRDDYQRSAPAVSHGLYLVPRVIE